MKENQSPLKKLRPIGISVRNHIEGIIGKVHFPHEKHEESPESPVAPEQEVLEKEVIQVEQEDDNLIIAQYRTHIIFFLRSFALSASLATIFLALLFTFSFSLMENEFIKYAFIILVAVPVFLALLARSLVYWFANTIVMREKNLIFHKYHGVFKQSTEVRSIAQIKSFDLVQSGIWKYFFNYGDIEVASIISGAAKSIVLKNISPVKEAYKTISEHISSLDDNKPASASNQVEGRDEDVQLEEE